MSNNLSPYEVFDFLKKNKIEVSDFKAAFDKKSAVNASSEIGFPVVLKTNSKKIVHKSDAGCVKVGLISKSDVENAYDEIINNAKRVDKKSNEEGVVVAKMLPKGVEVIIGVVKDPQFGYMIMFGLGGVFVELLKDVSFRKIPISLSDAAEMVDEVKGGALLKGFRGIPKSDIKSLCTLLVTVSKLAGKNKNIEELDLNPVIVYPAGCCAADGRIILKSNG